MKNINNAQQYIPKNNFFIMTNPTHLLVQCRIGHILKINSLYVCHIADCSYTPYFSIFLENNTVSNPNLFSNSRTYLYKDIPLPQNSSIIVLDKDSGLNLENTQGLYITSSHSNSISAFINYDDIY